MLMNMCLTGMIAMASPPGGGTGGQPNWMSTLMPLVVIFAIFYFLMIRPQQKQQKKMREMLTALKKGDRVVTRGGIVGVIHGIADNVITIEVAENVNIKFNRDAVIGVQSGSVEINQ